EGLKLSDYSTIRKCVQFVMDESGGGTTVSTPAPKVEAPVTQPSVSVEAKPAAPTPAVVKKTSASGMDEGQVKVEILQMISEKTGYPEDMLDIDLDMEADLGIDTVKQAELFASMREQYNIERKEGLKLSDYSTIRKCVQFVMEESGGGTTVSTPAPKVEAPVTQPSVSVEAKPAPVETKTAVAEKPPVTSSANEEKIKTEILHMISEKTGYPEDMLDIDLDMEADLGIDTVKQAELFASMRERYNIERKEGLKLSDYSTIRKCVQFVMEGAQGSETSSTAATQQTETVKKRIKEEKQKNLRNIIRLTEAPLTQQAKRKLSKTRSVIIFSDNAELTKAYQSEFDKTGVLSHVFTSAKAKSKNTTTVNFKDLQKVESVLKEFSAENPKISGIIYLLGAESKKLDTKVSPHDDLTRYAMPLFVACKLFEKDLADRADCDTFIAVNITLDGGFALKTNKGFDPVYGTIIGTTLCLRKDMLELTKTLTKLIDFDPSEKPQTMAQKTMSEILEGDNHCAVCFDGNKRMTFAAFPADIAKDKILYDLNGKTILVTGGGRGLGTMFCSEITKRYKANFILLDIIETDNKTADYAKMTDAQLKELKNSIWQEMKADKSKKATPVMLENRFTRITDAVTLYKNIENLKSQGSKVKYFACDVTDNKTLSKTFEKIKSTHGQIDGVVHFAGLERSKLVNEKQISEFYKVFDVKADSAMKFLSSGIVKEDGFWVFISSIAGKFGNLGQSDYAAASDYISKLAISLNNTGVKAFSFDMSAYADVGMAIRPGVKAFLESQGLVFIKPADGLGVIIDEIVYGSEPEIVLSSDLGTLDWDNQLKKTEYKAPKESVSGETVSTGSTGGTGTSMQQGNSPFIDKIESLQQGKSMLASKTFSLESDPYLADHSIGGTPYLPGVMGIETFFEVSKEFSGKNNNVLKNVHFSLPIKLLRDKPIEVKIEVQGNKIELKSDFIGPKGVKLQTRTHFTAEVAQSGKLEWDINKPDMKNFGNFEISKNKIYETYFHGPSFQVLEGICKVNEKNVFAVYNKPKASVWGKNPERKLLANPLIIEAIFQTCAYRSIHLSGTLSLPDIIGKVTVSDMGQVPDRLFIMGVFKEAKGNKTVYDGYAFNEKGELFATLKDYYMIGQ
ncbi:MAG TPA: SDR family NAD(P)-dependent oxidoreductase, partial [Elusimicrobiales bacterium]|nr:SDR family NAD(P)-dependent oxidoreductase [Elusimicrobiales bacterium]